jgi:hypothetical protein
MSNMMHWVYLHGNILAVLVTIAVAILVVCSLECVKCPKSEKDDLFRKHNL